MKKLILILFGLLLAVVVSAQSIRVYNQDVRINKTTPVLDLQGLGAKIYIDGGTSGTVTLQAYAAAGGTLVLPTSLSSDTLATRAYARTYGGGGGGGMIYPEAGIALSTSAAWSSSIPNNSTNWNTAYGWGNHASIGYALVGQTMYIGTTGVAINRASNPLTLSGITLVAPALGTPASGNLANCTFPTLNQSTTGSAATLTTPRTIGGVSFNGSANITVASATGGFTISGGNLALGANNITMSGSLGVTGTRLTKGWFVDLESTYVPTASGIPLGRISSITTTFTAGAETNVTLTGVTAEPYGITIFDANGLNITDAVKDSTAVSAGVYHTWVYSTDTKTNAKIKVLW
jgi:hypothetical protein